MSLPVLSITGQAADLRPEVRSAVLRHGAVIVRGLGLSDPAALASAGQALVGELLAEREQFVRRSLLADGVYSASEWPADQPMCAHNEQSYRLDVPWLMLFGCLRAADQGGDVTLADSSEVLRRLPEGLIDRFRDVGWQVVRNFGDDFIGIPWTEAFGTDDEASVEEYCRAQAIDWEWLPDGWLRTRQRRQAIPRHPVTGELCWFNQAAFLNAFSLDPVLREVFVDAFGADGLPFDTRFGDGEPIGEHAVNEINDICRDVSVRVPLRDGDLLVLDNIRMAHGREPYSGHREIAVAMGERVLIEPGDPVRRLPGRRTGSTGRPACL